MSGSEAEAKSAPPDAAQVAAGSEDGVGEKLTGNRLVGGASVEVLSFGVSQVIRLGSNLVLTRLLFPEAFGLMAMMQVVDYGLWMLSDVGIAQAVMMSPRGDEPVYRNTAWTMQVIRGFGLWIAALLLTWPISLGFGEPKLLWIIPLGTLGTAVHGLASTRVFVMRRQVRPWPIFWVDLSSQIAALIFMLVGASMGYGVMALVGGQIVHAGMFSLASWFLPGTHRDSFALEPAARKEILGFGRWIFFASALTFLGARGDQVILGRLLGASRLAFYNIALAFGEAPELLAGRVISSVLYPAIARIHNEEPENLADRYYKIRLWFDAVTQTVLGALIPLAHWIIAVLYDSRYELAGPMLQVIAVRTAIANVASPCETCLTAQGLSVYGFRRNVWVTASMFVAMPVGNYLGGTMGLLWGSAAARAMALIPLWPAAYKRGVLRLHREALVLVFLAAGYGLGLLALWLLPSVDTVHALARSVLDYVR